MVFCMTNIFKSNSISYSRNLFRNEHGMTLVSTIIAGVVGFIIMGSMMTMQINQMKQNKALEQKLETIELKESLIKLLSDKTSCDCIFVSQQTLTLPETLSTGLHNLTFKNCSGSALLEKNSVYSLSKTNLKISAIDLVNLKDNGSGNYEADLQIGFDPTSFVGPQLKPITMKEHFKVVGNTITACLGSATTSASTAKCPQIAQKLNIPKIGDFTFPDQIVCHYRSSSGGSTRENYRTFSLSDYIPTYNSLDPFVSYEYGGTFINFNPATGLFSSKSSAISANWDCIQPSAKIQDLPSVNSGTCE